MSPNDCSVVVLVKIGVLSILLGADLEEEGSCKGWTAILASPGRPDGKAGFFKVPHHGSQNAYHPDVWRLMLVENSVYAVAPYNRGRKLPRSEDITRLLNVSPEGYLTATMQKKTRKRVGTVAKVLNDMNIKLLPIDASTGQVRTRTSAIDGGIFGEVELFDGAQRMSASG